jgi:hypothetical protein
LTNRGTEDSGVTVLQRTVTRRRELPKALGDCVFYVKFEVVTAASIALMMEAASTCETSINFYQTTRHNNPEDSRHLLCFLYLQPLATREYRKTVGYFENIT